MFAFCLGVIDSYADRHEEDPNNTIYSSEVSVTPGGQATLTVSMKNSVEIGGFQFELYLPEGFTVDHSVDSYGDVVVNASLVENRTDLSRHTFQASFPTAGDYSHIRVLCYSSASKLFLNNDGAVATIVVNVAESVEEGDYTVEYKDVVISNATDTYATAKVTSTISVGEAAPDYDEGYAIKIMPFSYIEDLEVPFTINTITDLASVEFDVVIPHEFIENELQYFDAVLVKTKYTTNLEDNIEGAHIAVSRRSSNKLTDDMSVAKLGLVYDEVIEDGIYTIQIKNAVFTDVEGVEYHIAPYSADIYVGSPKASVDEDGVVAFHGDYSDQTTADLMLAAIPSEDKTVTTVDLTGVTALPAGKEIKVDNKNALITTSTDLGLTNDKNVVIGNECNNLVLTDGFNFSAKKTFTANEASYTREEMPNQWGTIILPYDVESNDDVAYYLPTAIEVGTLKLELKETLPANTPALVAKLNGNGIAPRNANVKVKTKDGVAVSGDVTMHGSYAQDTKITDANAYYISSNKFWKCNNYFYIDAFRAYMIIEGGSSAKSFVIDDSITAINAIVGEGDVTVLEYFDITGKRIDGLQKGVNILKLSNGKTQKVIVE